MRRSSRSWATACVSSWRRGLGRLGGGDGWPGLWGDCWGRWRKTEPCGTGSDAETKVTLTDICSILQSWLTRTWTVFMWWSTVCERTDVETNWDKLRLSSTENDARRRVSQSVWAWLRIESGSGQGTSPAKIHGILLFFALSLMTLMLEIYPSPTGQMFYGKRRKVSPKVASNWR